jgi:hypothetical protein
MPIAKQAHDGKIWAESNVTGKGETFILNLPFVVLSTPNEQIANSRPPLDSLLWRSKSPLAASSSILALRMFHHQNQWLHIFLALIC